MLPKFENDKQVKKELKYFKDAIDSMDEGSIKDKAFELYSSIKFYTNMIHEVHMSPINRRIDPTDVRRNIDELTDVRSKLNKLVNDYKKLK